MKLDKIRDLLLELNDINNQIDEIHSYASLVIENDLKIDIDFLFYKEKKKQEQPLQGGIFSLFTATSTADDEVEDSEWSMGLVVNQEVFLSMFGFLMTDLKKRKDSTLRKLKRLGVYEGAADTGKKD